MWHGLAPASSQGLSSGGGGMTVAMTVGGGHGPPRCQHTGACPPQGIRFSVILRMLHADR